MPIKLIVVVVILPTVNTHLLVFLTVILFFMSQSTSTPPAGPTNALTTYGKAARNPVCKRRSQELLDATLKRSRVLRPNKVTEITQQQRSGPSNEIS